MTDEIIATNGNGAGVDTGQFALQKLYMKDLSFEVPNAPAIFAESEIDPEIKLNLKNSHVKVDNNNYEVVLHVSVHATAGDRTVFMLELDQAGIFLMTGYSDEHLRTLIGTYCPSTLFPYARETISSAIVKGGFPAVYLQPINFEALYAQSVAEAAKA
jgi:preprotein translocase subunit SecB